MKITDSNLTKPASRDKKLFSNASRKLLMGMLARLQRGSLLLVEDTTEHLFGEPRQQASVQATVVIRDQAAFSMMLGSGSLGAGEAYMLGLWESPDLLQVIRLFGLNMDLLQSMDDHGSWPKRMAARLFHLLRRNTLQGSRANIAAHYDLSNEFFKLFLDPTMAYSAAIFTPDTTTLEQASTNKFRHVCQRLQLKS